MFYTNIKQITQDNTNFRHVIYTGVNSQLVVMNLLPNEEIGQEVHKESDQIIFFVQGKGKAIVGKDEKNVTSDDVIYIPAGVFHNILNTASEDLKLYTIYSPVHHAPGVIHKTKKDAEEEYI